MSASQETAPPSVARPVDYFLGRTATVDSDIMLKGLLSYQASSMTQFQNHAYASHCSPRAFERHRVGGRALVNRAFRLASHEDDSLFESYESTLGKLVVEKRLSSETYQRAYVLRINFGEGSEAQDRLRKENATVLATIRACRPRSFRDIPQLTGGLRIAESSNYQAMHTLREMLAPYTPSGATFSALSRLSLPTRPEIAKVSARTEEFQSST